MSRSPSGVRWTPGPRWEMIRRMANENDLVEIAARSAGTFNSAQRRSAVWFGLDTRDGALRRWSSQGRTVINVIQGRLGVAQDGAWGPDTNAALRAAATRYGLDPSVFVAGRVTPQAMAAALEIAYAIGHDVRPGSPVWMRVAVPPSAAMPRWNDAPPADGASSGLLEEEVLSGPSAGQPTQSQPPATTPQMTAPPETQPPGGLTYGQPQNAAARQRAKAVAAAAIGAGAVALVLWIAWPRQPAEPPKPAPEPAPAPPSRRRAR